MFLQKNIQKISLCRKYESQSKSTFYSKSITNRYMYNVQTQNIFILLFFSFCTQIRREQIIYMQNEGQYICLLILSNTINNLNKSPSRRVLNCWKYSNISQKQRAILLQVLHEKNYGVYLNIPIIKSSLLCSEKLFSIFSLIYCL